MLPCQAYQSLWYWVCWIPSGGFMTMDTWFIERRWGWAVGFERCNPSLLISFKHEDGQQRYIQIDAGKDFKEQEFCWFVPYKIPRLDVVRKGWSPFFWRFMFLHHLRCHASYLKVSQTSWHPLSVYDSLVWLHHFHNWQKLPACVEIDKNIACWEIVTIFYHV